jgi:hypothetical protein
MEIVRAAQDLLLLTKAKALDMVSTESRYLVTLPLYSGEDGGLLLLAHLNQAIESLPDRECRDAKLLLCPKDTNSSQTTRLKATKRSSNGDGRRWYGEWLMLQIAVRLADIAAAELFRTMRAYDVLEYRLGLAIKADALQDHLVRRDVVVEFNVPDQQFIGLRHQYHALEPIPNVEPRDPHHTWIGKIHTPRALDDQWWTHLISLGQRYDPGRPVLVATEEVYHDELRRATDGYPLMVGIEIMSERTQVIQLDLSLPPERVAGLAAEVVIEGPGKFAKKAVDFDEHGHAHYNAPPEEIATGVTFVLRCPPALKLYKNMD